MTLQAAPPPSVTAQAQKDGVGGMARRGRRGRRSNDDGQAAGLARPIGGAGEPLTSQNIGAGDGNRTRTISLGS